MEELSAATEAAVGVFLGVVSPTMGLMGLSGDTCRLPSCSGSTSGNMTVCSNNHTQ